MQPLFTDFTDIRELRANKSTHEREQTHQATPAPSKESSSLTAALEARILLTMKSREGKVNLLNAYLTRLKGVLC